MEVKARFESLMEVLPGENEVEKFYHIIAYAENYVAELAE
jgi:hypothetical protein